MSAARRSLLTATAAGTLLGALWFVPSANATWDGPAAEARAERTSTITQAKSASTDSASTDQSAQTQLADTGSFDTTPYVVGGTLFLGLGAGFVVYSVRRERDGASGAY
ncbi:LPXTG cell wall anchor domain-containing protein [Streptomyces sp. NPDC006365]|uniref:LPXTG cell wall anchor domain-containing protein n=1 Tax=unclassified Streptomyces TaxID=2593676 RepID=UPI00367FCA5C